MKIEAIPRRVIQCEVLLVATGAAVRYDEEICIVASCDFAEVSGKVLVNCRTGNAFPVDNDTLVEVVSGTVSWEPRA